MQIRPSEIIRELTVSVHADTTKSKGLAHDFAREFGWRPSDYFPAVANESASAHLLVEHGLKNTAVLTFLSVPSFSELSTTQTQRLLNLSYNNLIDWHIFISQTNANMLYNRVRESQAQIVHKVDFLQGERAFDELRSEKFDQIIGRKPNPNLPSLDNALIKNIANWKRKLSLEVENLTNQELSALFNAMFFVRTVEDNARSAKLRNGNNELPDKFLLELWQQTRNQPQRASNIGNTIHEAITQLLNGEEIPSYLFVKEHLEKFDGLEWFIVRNLITSFYYSESIPYAYDFSIMSKHALSRIYEQYVSTLKVIEPPETQQSSFSFYKTPPILQEEKDKAYGSFYTPQYIARFFAKFLRGFLPPRLFLTAKAADPACGSGIFLRTLLELRFEQTTEQSEENITPAIVRQSFIDVFGIDYDPNAAHATRLSLALLHLALKDSFPQNLQELESFPANLRILGNDAIDYFQHNEQELKDSQDIIIANPPFVTVDNQPAAIRERITLFMDNYAKGKIGTELAFLRLGLEMLKPGGIGLFVLPHSFLFLDGAAQMRQEIATKTDILCLADLSAINVFKDVGIYTVLLIFQKKSSATDEPKATLVRCQDFVERALQAVLDGNEVEKEAYSVYSVNQAFFQLKQWAVVTRAELSLENKYKLLPQISDYLEIRQGFVTGADDIFIRSASAIPPKERKLYAPYLPDREMVAYVVPDKAERFVFYPYVEGHLIIEDELRNKFPETWEYLLSNREKLEKRSGVGKAVWWKPSRARLPERLLRPKIVTPHLTIAPRFSLDLTGKYAISRSPLFYPKEGIGNEKDVLRFFLAVLNSSACYWYIANHSRKLGKGYAELEPKTLKHTPVPSPDTSPVKVRQILELVDRRMLTQGRDAIDLENRIDQLVADLYGLSAEERKTLGMEAYI